MVRSGEGGGDQNKYIGRSQGGMYASEMFKSFLIIIKFNVLQQNPTPKQQQGLLRPALVCLIWREKRRRRK